MLSPIAAADAAVQRSLAMWRRRWYRPAKRLKASYTAAYIQHAPMEPRAAVAEWQDGKLTVWTGTSNPFSVRQARQKFPHSRSQRARHRAGHGRWIRRQAHRRSSDRSGASCQRGRANPFRCAGPGPRSSRGPIAGRRRSSRSKPPSTRRSRILAWDFSNYNSGGSAIDTPYPRKMRESVTSQQLTAPSGLLPGAGFHSKQFRTRMFYGRTRRSR